ncbi:MAG: GNAT family N-acetyltransferase [Pseudomonadales bacterium]|nr:GNAT family N-acetyltransferase [Pseudomonadales bacterium]
MTVEQLETVSGEVVRAYLEQVPELNLDFTYAEADAVLAHKGSLFVGYVDDQPAGFKAGYDRYKDGSYYSWLGGVFPDFRRQQVAQKLLDAQEAWVRNQGYTAIYVKTRNRFVGMRIFLAKNGYDLVGINGPAETDADLRLLHYKVM